MTLQRAEFATDDPELAEDMIRQVYLDQHLSISGRSTEFRFGHSSLAVTGSHGFAFNRLHHTLSMHLQAEPLDDFLAADAPRRGVLEIGGSPEYDGVAAGPGEVLLVAPTGPFAAQFVEDVDLDLTGLARHEVAEHAAARCGIAPESLRFTGLAPISPAAGRLWLDTVAHVRDVILTEPELIAEPIVLDSAYRLLASTLLSTFPNTALDAVNDPLAAGPGEVEQDAADRAVDYVRAHAADPVTLGNLAAEVGAPTRDIDAALRRRRNTTLALQLWAARMQGTYRDLQLGDPAAGDTVTAIAARWGFTNPKTFTVAYTLATGGETPDDTLRR